jgi:atypical dual specificity phosphatase
MIAEHKHILPAFPRTLHLPYKPNASKDDVVAEEADAKVVFEQTVHVEEKIDGASVGMMLYDDHPIIRNRDYIMRKGYVKDTPAKKQFASVWNWWYDHKECFEKLHGFAVYGEWMKAQHGIHYTRLPDWFIAYDLFDHRIAQFLAPKTARRLLQEAGFTVPEVRFVGKIEDYNQFEEMANMPATWAEGKAEGVYVKVDNAEVVTHRFKMVRQDFIRGQFWDGKTLLKNSLGS